MRQSRMAAKTAAMNAARTDMTATARGLAHGENAARVATTDDRTWALAGAAPTPKVPLT